MKKLKFLLLPLSWLYAGILTIRHWLYDSGYFSVRSFPLPIICVGNLNLGGSGKTPMVEYLIERIGSFYPTAILSRGYGRKTKGYLYALPTHTAQELGDEPFQYKSKYPHTNIAVSERRVQGVERLLEECAPEVIILDDAFQHRSIAAGLNILLTPYYALFTHDYLLPCGNLRDLKKRAKHAQIIIVSKCPPHIQVAERKQIKAALAPHKNQQVYFSCIDYGSEVRNNTHAIALKEWIESPFVLLTGIAKAEPMVDYLKKLGAVFEHWEYPDHHHFTPKEMTKINNQKRLLTTEKDFARLGQNTNAYYLPIKTKIIDEEECFEKAIFSYIQNTKNPYLL